MKIYCDDEQAGWLKEVTLDPASGQPSHLVIQPLREDCPTVTILTALVRDLNDDEIHLVITLEAFEIICQNQRALRSDFPPSPSPTQRRFNLMIQNKETY